MRGKGLKRSRFYSDGPAINCDTSRDGDYRNVTVEVVLLDHRRE